MALLKAIKSLISLLRRKLIVVTTKDLIGTDASPNDVAPDELGCAESVTEILRAAGTYPKVEISTYRMYKFLESSPNWHRVDEPSPGDIVLSPTGYSRKVPAPFVGHTGIVLKEDLIASNDSRTGKFVPNYTPATWKSRWVKRGGYERIYYRYKIQ